MLAAIDLHGCDRARLADPDTIRRFVPAVIDGDRHAGARPLAIDRFGDAELEGWSAMQFIETSSITIHADEVWRRCFVDVFSCRRFDPERAAAIAVGHFGGDPRSGCSRGDRAGAAARRAGRGARGRRHRALRPRHPRRPDAPVPLDVADLGGARDRGVRVAAGRRRLVEPGDGSGQAVLTSVIFALAIRRGEGALGAVERVMLAVAAGGVVGWLIADEPVVATACVVAADLIGVAMMLPKTYRDPESETLATFALASVAGAFAAGAVGRLDAVAAAVPGLLLRRQRRDRAADRQSPRTSASSIVPALDADGLEAGGEEPRLGRDRLDHPARAEHARLVAGRSASAPPRTTLSTTISAPGRTSERPARGSPRALLVGVDEDEVERALDARAALERRADHDLDGSPTPARSRFARATSA